MILADTSVWIDHFRTGSSEMRLLLGQGQIAIHPFLVAELALGSLRDRARVLTYLDHLPQVTIARLEEVRTLIETRSLFSQGIGLTDVHLLASTLLTPGCLLWTRDKALRKVANTLGLHAELL